jgi:hypothetical protein
MRKPGAALIAHYLDPDRLPVHARWSRKHAHTQRRLCLLYVAPIIDAVTCQHIKTSHTQQIVNAAPTAGEGDRVRRMISALVTAGVDAGYLVNSRLAKVQWQAGDREGMRAACGHLQLQRLMPDLRADANQPVSLDPLERYSRPRPIHARSSTQKGPKFALNIWISMLPSISSRRLSSAHSC